MRSWRTQSFYINEYWNAVNAGAPPEELAQLARPLNPTLRASIDRIRALHHRRRPDPAFAANLEQLIMNNLASTLAGTTPFQTNGHSRSSAWTPIGQTAKAPSTERWSEPRRLTWNPASLATVALIGITLAIFLFTLWNPDRQPTILSGTPDAATPTAVVELTPTVEPVSMYRGGIERTGIMPGPAPTGRPGVLWQAETGAVNDGPVAVGNGLVYIGTNDGSVHAFDMTTGAKVWSLPGITTIESPSIVLDGATAYLTGYEGMVMAVDAVTGEEIWRTDPALNVSRRVAFDAQSSTLFVAGLNPVVYAFDSTNGSIKWQVAISGPQRSVSSIVSGDSLYFGTADGQLYALNTADGSTRWTWDSQHDLVRSLTYANGTIFGPVTSTADFAFVAIDSSTGTERWRLSSTEGEFQAASVVDGNVIISTAFGDVMSVSQIDGQINWTFSSDTGGSFAGPSGIVGENVYLTDTDGSLFALDLATGQELWRIKVDGGSNYDPVITGGVIYLGTLEGSIYALGDDGTELPAASPVASPIAAVASPEASPTVTDVDAAVEVIWQADGADGYLSSLAIAPDGKIWVADIANDGFQIFDVDGNFVESWTGTGEGSFVFYRSNGDPFNAITFAADGSYYVLDPNSRRIQAFGPDRTFIRSIGEAGREPGQFLEPIDVVIDPAGNIAVLDDVRRDIQTFATDGTLVATIPLQAAVPSGPNMNTMTVDSEGNYYVAELSEDAQMLRVVEKFDPEGNLLLQFGLAEGPGKLVIHPGGVGIDPAGNVYVVEQADNQRVLVFSPSGEYLTEFGGPESPALALVSPWDIVIDEDGDIFVSDGGANQLIKLRITELPASEAP